MSSQQLLSLDISNIDKFVKTDEIETLQSTVNKTVDSLLNKTCAGNDFLGWLNLPEKASKEELDNIQSISEEIKENADHLILIGIGGSYLGAKSAIEFMKPAFYPNVDKVLYMGHQLSADYTQRLFEYIENKSTYVNVVSKSGGTTEPAVAFRLLQKVLSKRYSEKELQKRIIATTDPKSGTLLKITDKMGYRNFSIPSDVGGRFSVFSPAGLLPIAAAGLDIYALMDGAKAMSEHVKTVKNTLENIALLYAAIRYLLYQKGKRIEVLSSFLPNLIYMGEWWKQLFGESEGKDQMGIFPTSVNFTTDLHSMGQFIQEGERNIFETFLSLRETSSSEFTTLNSVENDPDGLNYLAGKNISDINEKAYLGTIQAHIDGDVPNMTISIPEKNEFYLGQLYYFFEYAVSISGLLLDVNPFNQPGVEAYKTNMFRLLGKSGY
jgi:glucose-6-phosphate isomerase